MQTQHTCVMYMITYVQCFATHKNPVSSVVRASDF